MSFRIQLRITGDLAAAEPATDVDLPDDGAASAHDEIVRVLSMQCRALAVSGSASFYVSGFGQDPWPVDVETDLAVVLEQMPGVVSGLQREGEPFTLNFYEQGIERYLTGTRRADEVSFECMSMSLRWTAAPSIEILRLAEAESMFRELRDGYLGAVERVCPWTVEVPAFKRWWSSSDGDRSSRRPAP